MKGYAANNIFPAPLQRDFDRATVLVSRLPEKDFKGRLIRCHEVVRALKGMLPSPLGTWHVQDGHYRTVEHTWLVTYPSGHILDLYSVARYPMVQLLDWQIHFHRDLFRPGDKRHDIRNKVVRDLFWSARRA